MTLYELLNREIKRMAAGIGYQNKGNIHPLIMNEIEKYIIQIVLQETHYNYLAASKMLGIGRSTLYRKIEILGIVDPSPQVETLTTHLL
jgi:DNA-binding protein Fis